MLTASLRRFVHVTSPTLVLILFVVETSRAQAGMVTLDLGPAVFDDSRVSFDVSMNFTQDSPTEAVTFFGLDVSGSSTLLTGGGIDYSAFSFTRSAATADWDLLSDISLDGIAIADTIPLDPFAPLGTPLGAGTHIIGTIEVDLSVLALTPGTEVSVAIDAFDPFLGEPLTFVGIEDPFGVPVTSDILVPTFGSGAVSFMVPTPPPPPPTGDPIPEPTTIVLTALGLGALGARQARRRRGRGQNETENETAEG